MTKNSHANFSPSLPMRGVGRPTPKKKNILLGRHGTALVGGERWNLRNARFRHDHTPLDASCSCVACRHHTRAYLHHLIRSEELLGLTLLSIHNLTHLIRFTTAMGQAIRDGCFSEDFAPWEPSSRAHHTW